MIETDYKPHGVCSTNIHIQLSDDGQTIEGIEFTRGCDGNLRAISKLVKDMPVDQVVEILEGNTCGKRPTSCADQLTRGLREAQKLAGASE